MRVLICIALALSVSPVFSSPESPSTIPTPYPLDDIPVITQPYLTNAGVGRGPVRFSQDGQRVSVKSRNRFSSTIIDAHSGETRFADQSTVLLDAFGGRHTNQWHPAEDVMRGIPSELYFLGWPIFWDAEIVPEAWN